MSDLTVWGCVLAAQRRLVEIARAIVREPRIILMDEGAGSQGPIVKYLMDLIVKFIERQVYVLCDQVKVGGDIP